MLKKDNFFKNYFTNLSNYNKNLKKTKKVFNSFIVDLKNNQIPLLESYDKNYEFDFSKTTVKKFSSYKNIVIIGMGGSILGTKTIYSFLKKKDPLILPPDYENLPIPNEETVTGEISTFEKDLGTLIEDNSSTSSSVEDSILKKIRSK